MQVNGLGDPVTLNTKGRVSISTPWLFLLRLHSVIFPFPFLVWLAYLPQDMPHVYPLRLQSLGYRQQVPLIDR
jgi:hypothetical protein